MLTTQLRSGLAAVTRLISAGLLTLWAATGAPGAFAAESLVNLRTATCTIGLDPTGSVGSILRHDARNYLAPGHPAPLLSLRVSGELLAPTNALWNAQSRQLTLHYRGSRSAVIHAEAKTTHVVFEVASVEPAEGVELILWGPYPTTIGETIGETVGVVRDQEFAIGIQSLNARTLGGYPKENDIEADWSADDTGHYPELPPELKKDQLFRGDTARRTDFGSVLQAYCRNRDRDRLIANWGHEKYLAPAFHDGGVVGSRIALFAGPASKALETIGAIEVAEGLPHPLLGSVWGKVARQATSSYLIVDFGEGTIDQAIEMTKRAGLSYLYHSSPFETWGHFKLKPDLFPNGWAGLRTCVNKARPAGVRLGFHTLSNFITPNDSYVTPEPDPRLARIGVSALAADVDAEQKEITVAAPDFFRTKTPMNTVVVGQELVRYGSVSGAEPWRLLDCQRGAWGTRASAHARGGSVAKLMDHGYNVFLTDADLAQEVARKIAELCRETGARQLSFDGLEGNWSTGLGQYGRTLFTQAWYDALSSELRGQVINDASNPGHFNWHIYTRMNWGEPWYAGFRESQTLYRFKNQLYFTRNLMPRMLGWFALRPDTTIEDAEWLLARAAGFDAGFALATSLASTAQLAADPNSAETARRWGTRQAIWEAIKQWETARMTGAFPPEVRAALRDNNREFHLQAVRQDGWDLFEAHSERFTQEAAKAEPTECRVQNPHAAQPLQWILRSAGKQPVTGLVVEINGRPALALGEHPLPPGGSLRYPGGVEAMVYDSSGQELARVPVIAGAVTINSGAAQVKILSAPKPDASLKIEFRTFGPPTRLDRGQARAGEGIE